jgi:hypothetical protein
MLIPCQAKLVFGADPRHFAKICFPLELAALIKQGQRWQHVNAGRCLVDKLLQKWKFECTSMHTTFE